jgi:hypothetical protein
MCGPFLMEKYFHSKLTPSHIFYLPPSSFFYTCV